MNKFLNEIKKGVLVGFFIFIALPFPLLSATSPLMYVLISSLTSTTTSIVNYFSDYLFSGLTKQERLQRFLDDNRAQVAGDISRGGGEYLDSVAAIVEVYPMQRGQFAALLQKNFDRVFPERTGDNAIAAGAIITIAQNESMCDLL